MRRRQGSRRLGAAVWAALLAWAVATAAAGPAWAASHGASPAQQQQQQQQGQAASDELGFFITADRVVARGVHVEPAPGGPDHPFGVIVRFDEAWVDNLAITEDLSDEVGRPTWVQITSDGTAHVTDQAMRTDLFSLIASSEIPPGEDPIGYLLELLSGAAEGKIVFRNVAMRVLRAEVGHGEIPLMRARYVSDPSQLRHWDRIQRSSQQSRALWARYGSLEGYRRDGVASPLPGPAGDLLACVQRALGIDPGRLLEGLTATDPARLAAELERRLRELLARDPRAAQACLPGAGSGPASGTAQGPAQPGTGRRPGTPPPAIALPPLPPVPVLPVAPQPVRDLLDCVVDALNGLVKEPPRLERVTGSLEALGAWLAGTCEESLAATGGPVQETLRATLARALEADRLVDPVAGLVAGLLARPVGPAGASGSSEPTGAGADAGVGRSIGAVLGGVGQAVGGVVERATGLARLVVAP